MKRISNIVTLFVCCFTLNACKKDINRPIAPPVPVQLGLCEQMRLLESNREFIDNFKKLYAEVSINDFETGFVLTSKNDGSFKYGKIIGEKGQASISFQVPEPIDGFIHAHYSNLYSNFSASDIRAVYNVYDIGKMKNPKNFILGLVTAEGNAYILRISDPALFANFGKTNFDDELLYQTFQKRYSNLVKGYNQFDKIKSFELALLDVLRNSGLLLFKGNLQFNQWNIIEKAGETIITSTCGAAINAP